MILLIDNYDSFTYNLMQQVEMLGAKVLVKKNDEDISRLNPEKILISPGPGRPEDAGISMQTIKKYYQNTPILGVCLGHQCIAELFGSKIVQAKKIMHGKTSKINHTAKGIFNEVSQNIQVARYHSLAVDQLPQEFELLAWSEDDEIMAMKHKKYPLFGIQFHPESFLSEEGDKLIKNFLDV
jgi:anthranilate synthase/aminodeoxychorismate synthase-like glutamine amidotransferase